MKKTIALILALAQLAFGIVLISRGSLLDQKEENHISQIIAYGEPCCFEVSSFFYYAENDVPLAFNLENSVIGDGRYVEVTIYENGRAHLGPGSYDAPPEDTLYVDTQKDYYYRLDAASVRSAFPADAEDHWYTPYWIGASKGKYRIGDETHRVLAVASVYEGELVFTNLMVGDTWY